MAAVMILLPAVGGLLLLGFIRQLAPWLRHHASAGGVLIFAGATATLAGFSLVPTYALEMVAGWAFGPVVGLLASVVGLTGAAVINYGLANAVVHEHLLREMHANARSEAVRTAMVGSGRARAALIVALVRLAPIVPFGATNLLMASAGCPLSAFALGTALGTLPRTAAVVIMASQMSELRFDHHPWLFVAGLGATLIVIAILSYVAKRALAHVTGASAGNAPNA
jgi:uncharacterized membrane protein YdjX (TVP38/TMEM64 family)